MPFLDLSGRVAEVRNSIAEAAVRGGHGQTVRIVAVTKTHPPEAVNAIVESGIVDVGENKMQEALSKMSAVAAGVRWHLIGHLQRNKVKHLPAFHLFHALDSARLADAIESKFSSAEAPIGVLLQVNVAGEGSKGGYAPGEVEREAERLLEFGAIEVRGVMTMAPFEAAERELRRVFAGARAARDTLVAVGHPAFELSMGMSGDYLVAVEEGATIVRLGTILFGERPT